MFSSKAIAAIVQPNNKLDPSHEFRHARQAFATPVAAAGPKQLKRANAALLGVPRSEFRTSAVWLGATHPGLSWHVGSPSEMLPGLIRKVLEIPGRLDSPSLTAVILLFRLLQIHPFADANGRTARLWAIRHIEREIGPACGFLDLIDALWDRKRIDINALSLETQTERSFDPLFDHIETWFELQARNPRALRSKDANVNDKEIA